MLNIFTTTQVQDGVDSGDLMIDLSDYMKKKDGATKIELNDLTEVVSNKLDKTPQHKHDISDIKDLQEELDGKYDTSKQYPYNVILSNSEEISYLDAPRIRILDVAANKESIGYKFYVDDSNGDLMIVAPSDVLIASYSVTGGAWSFNGITDRNNDDITGLDTRVKALETTVTENSGHITENSVDIASESAKIKALQNSFNEYIAKTDAVLRNHYEAILELCEKHGMIDSKQDDGDNITPE